MKYLTDNELFNVFLLCTIIGEFLLPCLLERYYTEYNGKTMVMSALGSSQSPVRLMCFVMGDKKQFQNTVLIYEGLWERLTLICMYIPFIHKAVYNLLS